MNMPDPRDQMRDRTNMMQQDIARDEREKKKKREKELKVKIKEKIKLEKALTKKFDPKEINKQAQGQKGDQKSAGNAAKAQ